MNLKKEEEHQFFTALYNDLITSEISIQKVIAIPPEMSIEIYLFNARINTIHEMLTGEWVHWYDSLAPLVTPEKYSDYLDILVRYEKWLEGKNLLEELCHHTN